MVEVVDLDALRAASDFWSSNVFEFADLMGT
jgi:hypothetical protein